MRGARWIVGVGALIVALLALFVLLNGTGPKTGSGGAGSVARGRATGPAMEEIDAQSRDAMRDILRDSDG